MIWSGRGRRLHRTVRAGVAELVDAPDLGSGGRSPWRFKSSRPHRCRHARDATTRSGSHPMMKTTIERLDDTQAAARRRGARGRPARMRWTTTLVHMGRELNIPGFRPGKVPPQAVMARLGRDAVVDETIRVHLDDWYRAAVISSGVRPVAQPEIDIAARTARRRRRPLTLLRDGRGGAQAEAARARDARGRQAEPARHAEVRRPGARGDAARRRRRSRTPAAPAEEGDEVVVDFRCTVDGEDVDGAAATGYQARLGDGRLLAELEAAIVGEEAGADARRAGRRSRTTTRCRSSQARTRRST